MSGTPCTRPCMRPARCLGPPCKQGSCRTRPVMPTPGTWGQGGAHATEVRCRVNNTELTRTCTCMHAVKGRRTCDGREGQCSAERSHPHMPRCSHTCFPTSPHDPAQALLPPLMHPAVQEQQEQWMPRNPVPTHMRCMSLHSPGSIHSSSTGTLKVSGRKGRLCTHCMCEKPCGTCSKG